MASARSRRSEFRVRRFKVLGRDKDKVEFALGEDNLHLIITTRGDTKNVQTVMVTGCGLRKIAEQIAHHIGYRLELIR